VAFVLAMPMQAQQLIAVGGGSAPVPGGQVSWSLGELFTTAGTVPGGLVTQGFQQPDPIRVRVNLAALLEGPYNSGTGLMADALRSGGWLPLVEPYTALGYTQVANAGGESTTGTVLAVAGNNAIVDWVFLELRDKNDHTVVKATRAALIQRDGDIVDTDGTSAVRFNVGPDLYYLAVFHRNHLAILTLNTVALSTTATTVNLRTAATPTFGTAARKSVGGAFPAEVLWAGDVRGNDDLKYTGGSNDRDPILSRIGGSTPTLTVAGYWPEDVTLDAVVKYTGGANDRDPILLNIGGSVPTAVRNAQLP
jgi:hypothetical protein